MPMKVVVCFDSVRVTVPCGEGEISVKELISKAVHRYKRAVGKGANHWVEVTNLKTISGGGILDPDDQLCDVVDDREQLIAEFDEQNRPSLASLSIQHHQHHNGGDGASASSTGTTSPEPFSHLQNQLPLPHHAPGDSISSSSSSTAPPPLPSIPPPQAPSMFGAPPLVPPIQLSSQSSEVVVVGGGDTTRRDSSSSNSNNAVTDVVVVTPRDLSLGSTLRVRRGSEPSLATLVDSISPEKSSFPTGNLRPFLPRRESVRDSDEPRSESSDEEKHMRLPMTNSLDRKKIGMARFMRDSLRSSLSSRPEMYRWLEAQQRAEEQNKARRLEERMGPVEGHDGEDVNNATTRNECVVYLQNDGGPLGIHAVPAQDNNGADVGLLIQSIEPGRPVHRDGRIQAKDIIVEINGTSLHRVPFLKAQEVFRAAMDTHEICLKVVKGDNSDSLPPELPAKRKPAPQPPPVMPKPRHHAPLKPSPLVTSPPQKPSPAPRDLSKSAPDTPSFILSSSINGTQPSHIADSVADASAIGGATSTILSAAAALNPASQANNDGVSPDLLPSSFPKNPVIKPGPPIKAPKKAAPALPARNPNTQVTSATSTAEALQSPQSSPSPSAASMPSILTADAPINAVFNTRRIGKKIVINLRKGPLGLGFSVTSRDNQTGGDCPIYIRNILPKGAAVQDGQLRSGDRLLEVNGVEMTGKTQPEAVSFLRTLPEGSMVELVVSRQEEVDEKFKVPRKMGEEAPLPDSQEHAPVLAPHPPPDTNISAGFGNDDDVVGGGSEDDDDEDLPHTVPLQYPSQSLDSIDGGVSAKDTLTLRIPLNDTGSAGLGVSVKGKTQSSAAGLKDLGIFVKTVLKGGAAYKDGRLRVNDQLLEVNGIRLEGQPNATAMDALRSAMMEEGSGSGFITLSIQRRAQGGSPMSPSSEGVGQTGVAGTNVGPGVHKNHGVPHHHHPYPGHVPSAGVPIIHHRSSSASDALHSRIEKFGGNDSIDMPSPIPPARTKRVAALRERFQSESSGKLRNDSYMRANNDSLSMSPPGGGSSGGLRNESYARATQDSMNDSGAFSQVLPSQHKWSHPSGRLQDSKENIPVSDQDTYALPNKLQQRPHSTIGFLHGSRVSHNSVSDDEAFLRDSTASSKEESDLSPSIDLVAPFAREGFGRQSMSEKRKGHLDPRSTETYKMVKANKENKGSPSPAAKDGGSRPLPPWPPAQHTNPQGPSSQPPVASTDLPDLPPSTAPAPQSNPLHEAVHSTYQPSRPAVEQAASLKKSSSVEDLSNPGPHVVNSSSSGVNQNRDASPMWRQNRFGRSRACNDSFRAAVDRSYDALDPALMDTLEEESAESGAFTLDPSNSGRSSISSDNPEDTNSLKRRKAKEKEKKGGLLKGFLRFGKGRKSNEEAMRRSRSEERPGDRAFVQRHQDFSADPPGGEDDAWAGQFGDAKTMGFTATVTDTDHQPQQRGRRLSKPDQERIDEEYARLRDYHVSEQRLRSQSVDPSAHHTYNSQPAFTGPSSWQERSSPFQPYRQQHQGYYREEQGHYTPDKGCYVDERDRRLESETDPRQIHPAAFGYRQGMTGLDHRGQKQFFPETEHNEARPPLTKAVLSRAEYIQQLRSLYQQRHKERQGVYPLDDEEEKYERQIQEMEGRGLSVNSESLNDVSRDQLLRFTDRPPGRPIEQHKSERTLSSSSMGNSNKNLNSVYGGGAGGNYGQYHYNDYSSSSTAFHMKRPHSRGAATGYEKSSYHHQNVHSNYQTQYHPHHHQHHPQQHQQHHHHHQQQQQHPHELRGYNYFNYREYSNSQDNGSGPYRRPSYEAYAQDQFYRGAPQAYRSAPNQFPSHRSTTPYSDPTSAKV